RKTVPGARRRTSLCADGPGKDVRRSGRDGLTLRDELREPLVDDVADVDRAVARDREVVRLAVLVRTVARPAGHAEHAAVRVELHDLAVEARGHVELAVPRARAAAQSRGVHS